MTKDTKTAAKPTSVPRGVDLWPYFVALLRRNDGEMFISHEELGEAVIFDRSIIVERREDGAVYRLVESPEPAEERVT